MSESAHVEIVDAAPNVDGPWPPLLNRAPAAGSVAAWLNYDRSPTFECVEVDVRVPMRDGIDLVGRLYRPGRDGEPDAALHPGIITEFSPYAEETQPIRARYLAERGYNVLHCNVRGSGNSGGSFGTWF